MKSEVVFENSFFAVKLASIDEERSFWEILRKVNSFPYASGELIEIIAPCIQRNINLFFFNLNDFDLCNDIGSLGAERIGYLNEAKDNGIYLNGWGEVWNAEICEVGGIQVSSIIKKNLFSISELKHSINDKDALFLEAFFKRDRMFWGLTKADQKWVRTNEHRLEKNETISDVETLFEKRQSASKFGPNGISVDEFYELLKRALFRKKDGHYPFGVAGGFSCINVYAIIKPNANLGSGIHKIDLSAGSIEYVKDYSNFDLLNNFLFLSDDLWQAKVYLFFSISFNGISEKYGQRAIRLSLLSLGGALQQTNLAAASLGIGFRTIGGFDELQCSSILNLKNDEYLACAAVLGR
jgi:SagB-type dehydrogenase family enzyme